MIDWSVSSEGREWASTSSYILIVAVLDAVVTLQTKVNVVGVTATRWFRRSSPKCSTN